MKQQKKAANWYIAATLYLTSLAIPVLFALLIGFLLAFTQEIGTLITQSWLPIGFVILSCVYVASIWFGVAYSARYTLKTYIIENPSAVWKFANIYTAVVGLLFVFSDKEHALQAFFASIVYFFLFYFGSKRYFLSAKASKKESI